MKSVIGKFGAGAKAGLATGVDYFIMNTTYNGYRTSFMIFKQDYEAITPESPNGKVEIWKVKMADGTIHDKEIYWEKVKETNGVEIILEVKKHNKMAFINAVKDQFQYFDGKVRVIYTDNYGDLMDNKLNDPPIYQSDILLIPRYSTYSVPHILVDGIAYGPVSWPELELENRQGKIAIKVKATDVDITQSREALKWTEKTKRVILQAITNAQEEATDFITKELTVTDKNNLFELNTAYSAISRNTTDEVSSAFTKFLNLRSLTAKFEFPLGEGIVSTKLDNKLFEFLFYEYSLKIVSTSNNGGKLSLHTNVVDTFEQLRNATIVYADEASLGPKLADHILNQKFDLNSFIYVRPRTDRTRVLLTLDKNEYNTEEVRKYTHDLLVKYSQLFLDTYDIVYDEKVQELDNAVIYSQESAAKSRRNNKEILYTWYENASITPGNYYNSQRHSSVMVRETIKVVNLPSHFEKLNEDIVITTGTYRNLATFVELMNIILPKKAVRIIHISQENVKYFLPYGTLITDYFRTVNHKNGELMIGEHIRALNTVKKVNELQKKYKDFSGNEEYIKALTSIDIEQYSNVRANSYKKSLKELLKTCYQLDDNLITAIYGYLDTISEFHTIVRTGDKEEISKAALRMFNSEDIYHIDAYDEDYVTKIEEEFKRINSIALVLNILPNYTPEEEVVALLNLLIITKNNQINDEL